MTTVPDKRCATCAHWDCGACEGHGYSRGLCRRDAPRLNEITAGAVWPRSHEDDWCGEWKALEDHQP
jgi:hypothetical protein